MTKNSRQTTKEETFQTTPASREAKGGAGQWQVAHWLRPKGIMSEQQVRPDQSGQRPHSRTPCDMTVRVTRRLSCAKRSNLFHEHQQQQQQTRRRTIVRQCQSLCWLAALMCLARGLAQTVQPADGQQPNGRLVINIATSPGSQQTGRRILLKRATGESRSARLQEVDALAYLERYGYMNSTQSNANLISEDSFQEAVMSFQRFAGLPETGRMDSQTAELMQAPRCGNRDKNGRGENGRRRRRRKRYALQGSKWRRQELTYRISQYPTRFQHKKHEVDGQIEKAFKIWSQVAPIDFVAKREGRVHIDIRFASGEHGDGDPFDGPGNTLAHAYFPQYGGDAHFDDQEFWTVDSYAGTNIFQVAAHELGHSLGLGHSSVREALMAPFYQKYKPNFKLHADDILGIQALYGQKDDSSPDEAPSSETPRRPTTSRPSSSPGSTPAATRPTDEQPHGRSDPTDLCQEASIDAITRTEDGSTYVFKGHHYWLLTADGIAEGYPARISRDWPGLPANLDAALTWSDGKTFFFKGDKYWRFFNKRPEPGYPKLISAGFAGIPNNVDAAFVWSGNGKTYFFKRDKYWRFDSKQEPPVSSQYPKSVKNWVGLPSGGIDAAFKWDNGMTYFFKDELYYRFDDRQFEVDTSARPAFPRNSGEWWFGCTNSNLPVRVDPSSGPINSPPSDQLEASTSSLSRSIFSSLSSLFGSSPDETSSTRKPARASQHQSGQINARSLDDDWSFHRGLGEEVRRLLVGSHRHKPSVTRDSEQSTVARQPDNSRWSFPLGSSIFSSNTNSRGEQSLSELKMLPDDEQTQPAINGTQMSSR